MSKAVKKYARGRITSIWSLIGCEGQKISKNLDGISGF